MSHRLPNSFLGPLRKYLCILYSNVNSNKLHIHQGPFVQSIFGLNFVWCSLHEMSYKLNMDFFMKYSEYIVLLNESKEDAGFIL